MFKRFFRKLSEDAGDRRTESIRAWAQSQPGVTLIADTAPRTVAKVAGVVEGMRVRPREGVQAIEAVITDGSGSVTAVWLGRRSIPGLMLGSRLIIEGRFGGDPEHLQVMNPSFEFAAGSSGH